MTPDEFIKKWQGFKGFLEDLSSTDTPPEGWGICKDFEDNTEWYDTPEWCTMLEDAEKAGILQEAIIDDPSDLESRYVFTNLGRLLNKLGVFDGDR